MADLSHDQQASLMLKLHRSNMEMFACGAEHLRSPCDGVAKADKMPDNQFLQSVMDETIHELAETELRIDLDKSFRAAR